MLEIDISMTSSQYFIHAIFFSIGYSTVEFMKNLSCTFLNPLFIVNGVHPKFKLAKISLNQLSKPFLTEKISNFYWKRISKVDKSVNISDWNDESFEITDLQ